MNDPKGEKKTPVSARELHRDGAKTGDALDGPTTKGMGSDGQYPSVEDALEADEASLSNRGRRLAKVER